MNGFIFKKNTLFLVLLFVCLKINCTNEQNYSEIKAIVDQFEQELFDGAVMHKGSDTCRAREFTEQITNNDVIRKQKAWTIIVYIAADNDLKKFSVRNIKQMAQIGSNQFVNIFAHVDIKVANNQKITRRYYIEKEKATCVNIDDPDTQQMNSGDPATLISCCKYAVKHYPADHYMLVMWNHGTGVLDPIGGPRITDPSNFFVFNPNTCKLEVDRSVEFLEAVTDNPDDFVRGVCWDDTTGQYLTNQKLRSALKYITDKILHGKKLDIIAFDACLMAMLEIAVTIKKYANISVFSQEVELGTGWDYEAALSPFLTHSPTPLELADNLVQSYALTYNAITDDYTQSAINLGNVEAIESNVNTVAKLLEIALTKQWNNSVKNALKLCRDRRRCTHFSEPSYIDLFHFYQNVLGSLGSFMFNDAASREAFIQELQKHLLIGLDLIKSITIANRVGKNLANAHGLSIYFPERLIHQSYPPENFASSAWVSFLKRYLA